MGLLRILLAIAVIIEHSKPILGVELCGGGPAVNIFFAISGFYMALVLNTKYKQCLPFYRARLVRLAPVYWMALIITSIGLLLRWRLTGRATFGIKQWVESPPHGLALIGLLITNLTLFGSNLLDCFKTPSGSYLDYQIVRQSWSLGVELMFYVSAPFLVRRVSLIAAAAAGSLVLNAIPHPAIFHFFYPQWPLFLCGAFVWHFSAWLTKAWFLIPPAWLLILHAPVGLPWNVAFYLLIILSFPALLDFTNRHPYDRLTGELSYPVYVIHWFVLMCTYQFLPKLGPLLFSIASPACVILAGVFLYMFDVRIQAKIHGHTVPVHPFVKWGLARFKTSGHIGRDAH